MTPDFAEFLLSVPKDQRQGLVFNVVGKRGITTRSDTASKLVVRLGKTAQGKVDESKGKTSYASAHDLRRGFGMRWARRVMPMVLKELMRHESVTTTEKYYVDIDADGTAALLAGLTPKGDTLVDTAPKQASSEPA